MSVMYRHRRHNKNLLMVHLIFVNKYRHRLLHGNFYNDVHGYLYNCCIFYNWYVRRMDFDGYYIHILLQYNPTDSISRIVSILKQCSTRYTWRDYDSFFTPVLLDVTNSVVRWLFCCFCWNGVQRRNRTLYQK